MGESDFPIQISPRAPKKSPHRNHFAVRAFDLSHLLGSGTTSPTRFVPRERIFARDEGEACALTSAPGVRGGSLGQATDPREPPRPAGAH
jgi:hypothetical protein